MKAQQRKLPLSLMGKSFYLIALLYQLFAIAFFTADCVDRCVESGTTALVADVCEVLYLPQAYLMGMCCSLGYGTLLTRFAGKRIAVLALTWTVIFLACLLDVSRSLQPASSTLLIGCFAFQLLVTVHTLWLLGKKQQKCWEEGHYDDAVNLHKSHRQFRLIFLLCVALFAIDTVYDLKGQEGLHREESLGLWVGFVVITAAANSWILVLLRPHERVGDIAELTAKLDMLESSEGLVQQ